ncbi:MAG: molybdenum cofactor guanylyltransferase [Pseudomonadota bacterium]
MNGYKRDTPPCSGVILAGGLNTRMGENKALLTIQGERILDRLYRIFRELFDDIILVTNQPLDYLGWNLKIVTDLYPVRSSLVGIHAGLFYASHPHAFVAACDIPFLKKELVEILLGELEPRWDIILPVTSDGHQPLCAVYSKRCIKQIEAQINQKDFKIADLFQEVRVKRVPESSLKQVDPALVSFFNINTQKDLAAAEQIDA